MPSSTTTTQNKNKRVKLITLRQSIVTLSGLLLMFLTLFISPNYDRFFHLTYYVESGGHYMNNATLFLIGLIIFIYGLYDILKSIYFLRPLKHKKK